MKHFCTLPIEYDHEALLVEYERALKKHGWSEKYTINGERPVAFEHVNLLDDMEEYPESYRIFNVTCDFLNDERQWPYQVYGFLHMSQRKVYGCHQDAGFIVHFPIVTNKKCKMIIEDEQMHLPVGTATLVNSVRLHTAYNLSYEGRIHLTYPAGPTTKERIIDKYFPLNRTLPPFGS